MESEVAMEAPPVAPEEAEEAGSNKTQKTGYIVLKVDLHHNPASSGNFPKLSVMNGRMVDGQPDPVAAYSRPQAVKTLLTELGMADDPTGDGDFIAIPVRSFRVITRRLENSIIESMTDGAL